MCHAFTGFFAFVHKSPPFIIVSLFPVNQNLSLSKSPKYFLFIEVSCDTPAYNDLFIFSILESPLSAILGIKETETGTEKKNLDIYLIPLTKINSK